MRSHSVRPFDKCNHPDMKDSPDQRHNGWLTQQQQAQKTLAPLSRLVGDSDVTSARQRAAAVSGATPRAALTPARAPGSWWGGVTRHVSPPSLPSLSPPRLALSLSSVSVGGPERERERGRDGERERGSETRHPEERERGRERDTERVSGGLEEKKKSVKKERLLTPTLISVKQVAKLRGGEMSHSGQDAAVETEWTGQLELVGGRERAREEVFPRVGTVASSFRCNLRAGLHAAAASPAAPAVLVVVVTGREATRGPHREVCAPLWKALERGPSSAPGARRKEGERRPERAPWFADTAAEAVRSEKFHLN